MVKRDSNSMLEALNQSAIALMTELDVDRLLDAILDQVCTVFGVERCAVLTVDEDRGLLVLRRSRGYDAAVATGFAEPIGQGISGWVASVGLPAFVPDVSLDPRYVPGVSGAVSEAAIPLRRKDRIVGVLDMESQTRLEQQDFDLVALNLFASHCAAALYNASLVAQLEAGKAQLKDRVRELQVLNHVGRLLGEIRTLDEVLQEILRVARDVLSFKACAVLLPDATDEELLKIEASIGYPPDTVASVRIRKDQGVTGQVFRSGVPKLVSDIRKIPGYIPGIVGGRCEMACPLLARGKVVGVLDAEGEQVGCFTSNDFVLFSTFATQAAVAIRNAQMLERTQSIYYQTISSLADALEARDSYTRGHSERVTNLALELARRLSLSEREQELVRQAGLLHDIGKIGIPDRVLNKNGHLNSAERTTIEDHPMAGNHILGQLKFLEQAGKAILHHHERFDGTGYPSGLLGQEIPMVARIIAVADAWDAMTSTRPYREALVPMDALRELTAASGSQFDPDVIRTFLAYLQDRALLPKGWSPS